MIKLITLNFLCSIMAAFAEIQPYIFLEAPLFNAEHNGEIIKVKFAANGYVSKVNGVESKTVECDIELSITLGSITNSRYIDLNRLKENIIITKDKEGLKKIDVSEFLVFKKKNKSWILEYKGINKSLITTKVDSNKVQFLHDRIEHINKNKDNYVKLWEQLSAIWFKPPIEENQKRGEPKEGQAKNKGKR